MMRLLAVICILTLALFANPSAAQEKPNILVIWGDDVGISNISAYHRGMLGGSTPNIDRIANEGALLQITTRSNPVRPEDHLS